MEQARATYFGDANLDGEFNSGDFVQVFAARQYEDEIVGNSTWASGDWNGDFEFGTLDFLVAFQTGGYELGQRAAQSVPEPTGVLLFLMVCHFQFVARIDGELTACATSASAVTMTVGTWSLDGQQNDVSHPKATTTLSSDSSQDLACRILLRVKPDRFTPSEWAAIWLP